MKNLLYIMVGLLILTACDDDCDPVKVPGKTDTVYVTCNPPVKIPGIGYHTPPAHKRQSVSFDYQFLAFKNDANVLKVLDLHTSKIDNYILDNYLPLNVKLLEIEYLDWSPYDNHRILVQAKTRTDTSDTDNKYVEGWNLYIFDIQTRVLDRISPNHGGPYGVYWGAGGAFGRLQTTVWLPQSKPGRNLILIPDFVFIFEGDKYINTDFGSESYISNNGLYTIFFQQTEPFGDIENYYGMVENIGEDFKNNTYFAFYYTGLIKATKISWSPDDKYIAISSRATDDAEPPASQRYFEIMIVDFDKLWTQKKQDIDPKIEAEYTINLRKEFCKYAFADPYVFAVTVLDAEFISDTTMAVSMHEDGAEYSYLYEISIHGEMIRQLTFEP